MPGRILIVDDEPDMLALLTRIVSQKTGHRLVTESDPVSAIEAFRRQPFDLVITDLKMPKWDGIRVLEEVKRVNPKVPVVIMTAYGTIETAVEAIQKGAYDYLTKPFQKERILLTIEKAMEWAEMVKENLALRQALEEKDVFASFIGTTPVMKEIFERVKQVAPTNATVLITGPSGTGKELLAKAIYQRSTRNSKRMIVVNCAAIPEQVIESELFGHVKGAFTGAWKDKKGLVEEAHQGTLFLDEIGELGLNMQTKLLRLLQDGEYRPVGSVQTRHADIRFIAATNHNLEEAIKERRFREDLYYRLNIVHFHLPPLKERKEDIPLLGEHFLKKYSLIHQKEVREIAPSAMQLLLSQEFPGNVRELENIIERAVIFCRKDVLDEEDLFPNREKREDGSVPFPQDLYRLPFREAKEMAIRHFHRQYIRALLKENTGNISKAAAVAGIQRQYLYQLMKEEGISPDAFKTKTGLREG